MLVYGQFYSGYGMTHKLNHVYDRRFYKHKYEVVYESLFNVSCCTRACFVHLTIVYGSFDFQPSVPSTLSTPIESIRQEKKNKKKIPEEIFER